MFDIHRELVFSGKTDKVKGCMRVATLACVWSLIFIHYKPVHVLIRVDKRFRHTRKNILSTLICRMLSIVLYTLVNSRSFDKDMHESRKNSGTNFCLLAFINPHEAVWPGHESWENFHTNSRFSTFINSYTTVVLVWPGHESLENSHTNSRFSTLINSHTTFVLVWLACASWQNSH